MRKTILALATAGALAGTALPALAWDRDDDYGHYRHWYYRSDYYRPYYRRYDYDEYRPYREHHWWWWRNHHHHDYDHDYYDRPYYRRYH
jgi:hypothetical protein